MISSTILHLMRSTAPTALLLAAAPAAAQAVVPAQDTAERSQPDSGIVDPQAPQGDDIIVVGTAGGGTRRQDAAFAVTTLSDDAIERAAPNSTADLLRTVPGVMAESSGGQNGANIFVRGYPSGGDAQFVTFQFGGVPIFPPPTLSFLENSQLIRLDETVQRVEAVRGGTGSLFSNGQPGLTVNVVPRTGGSTLHGLAKFSYTDYDEARGDAWVSGPLGENTGFMIGGFYAQGNGIRDPRFRAEQGGQVTANIHHDFDTRGSVEIYARYLNDRGQWLLPIPVIQNGRRISEYPGFDAGTGTLLGPETRRTTNLQGATVDLQNGRGADVINTGLTFDYEVATGLRVRERMSYLGGRADTNGLVPDGPPVAASALATTLGGTGSTVASLAYVNGGGALGPDTAVMRAGIWSVQKKITSFVADTALEWKAGGNTLTGGFYYADYTTRDQWALGNQVLLTAEPNARLLDLTLNGGRTATRGGFVGGNGFLVDANYKGADLAFYAVDEWQITPELRIDGGARYQKHIVDGTLRTPAATPVNLDGNAATLYDNAVNVFGDPRTLAPYREGRWSWTAGANYDVTSQAGVFARYSRGHSFPQFDNLRENLTIVAKVDTYEGGLKVSMPWLNLYATVFHNEFDGLATTQLINNVALSQVGGAKATGVELEGALRPFAGFSLAAAGTFLDGTYQDFFTGGGTIDNTGNRVQRQPRWMWRVTPSYELPLGTLRPSLFATLQYTGDRFSDPENQQLLPRFYQLDAGVSVDVAERLRLQVTGNNLTNEIGLTEGNPRIIGSQGTGPVLARPILGRSLRFSAALTF
ncbi:outer membrane receptor protein involved in Fe transport [Sphingomonas sp. BE138]|uniref:TonB-dependent receptor n=1 Tax=Sphingomonas sp. BE138 TaxID=2817845 RepID=UPI00286576D1|nr:TonB-dependent receptor [Sphingomonas sp. BE138]MDR6787596.1 outer membrane receptor protein involved in Fe transport [Sphingomonas sp. BE138]